MSGQKEVRRKLIASGHNPLAIRDKSPVSRGWLTLSREEIMHRHAVDPDWENAPATSVRLDNGLACIDVDVKDSPLSSIIRYGVLAEFGLLKDAVWRFNDRTASFAVFFRSEAFGFKSTEEYDCGEVELFSPDSGCHVGVSGLRSTADGSRYLWGDRNLTNVGADDLPFLSASDVSDLRAALDKFLSRNGEMRSRGAPDRPAYGNVHAWRREHVLEPSTEVLLCPLEDAKRNVVPRPPYPDPDGDRPLWFLQRMSETDVKNLAVHAVNAFNEYWLDLIRVHHDGWGPMDVRLTRACTVILLDRRRLIQFREKDENIALHRYDEARRMNPLWFVKKMV